MLMNTLPAVFGDFEIKPIQITSNVGLRTLVEDKETAQVP